MEFSVKDFDYNLPLELIAQNQIKPRDHSRLLLLNKKNGEIAHEHFYNIINYLHKGDLLVLNNSKVFPARLIGHKKETGGEIEIFLHQKIKNNIWQCLLRGRIKIGLIIVVGDQLQAEVISNNNDGTWLVKFNIGGQSFWETINRLGEVPLPPYIKRDKQSSSDKNNYQTVFADDKKIGSVAAPTAGLHLTESLLKKIKARGVKIVYVTLHVGLGTFAPMKTEKIKDHIMHSEFAEISASTIKAVLKAKKNGARVIPLGTTSCRSLESIDWKKLEKAQIIKMQSFWTDIFIYPGYKFQVVNALITNFHLPKSTLLMLVSALAGQEKIKAAYSEAIRQKYRFFSYGDAMFIY
ncbi:MAG: tRNA preQ1(34) S-adenosylmethionine ribosyltransferase-isomerase QueA [Candidatus Falkowbacteria bacterium]